MSQTVTTGKKLRVCMVVACANDVSGSSMRDDARMSPVLHPAIHNLLDGLKCRQDIEVEVIYGRRNPVAGEDRWEGSLHYVPVKYRPLPIPGMGGPYLARTIVLLRHIQKTKPDVVHGQGTERESGLVAALSRRPAVLTLHGNFREIAKLIVGPFWNYYKLNAKLETFALKRVHGVICISEYTKQLVTHISAKTWTIANAVDKEFFAIKGTPVKGRIVCLAGVNAGKNQVAFLENLKRNDCARACNFIFYGYVNTNHPYGKQFMEQIHELKSATFGGVLTTAEVSLVLKSADVLVLPSLYDNSPVCILEAMAAGVPVVASNVGGIPELVKCGKTGFLTQSDQLQEMIKRIKEIVMDRAMRERMSVAARERALERYTPQAVAAEHVVIYQKLLDGSK